MRVLRWRWNPCHFGARFYGGTPATTTSSSATVLSEGASDVDAVASSVGQVGLQLRPDCPDPYPPVVVELVHLLTRSPATVQLERSLSQIKDVRAPNLLIRHFATQDDLGNAFRVLHVMKRLGIARDRETYRYLMYATCKYADIDLGLFVMENMLHDQKPDFGSFKRLFDTCASAVDLRLWVAYDVMMWFYPLKGFPSAALRTTCYITEAMRVLGLRQSSRAGRGFITLPNPRGDPPDPMAGMFEDNDPNYEHENSLSNLLPPNATQGAPLIQGASATLAIADHLEDSSEQQDPSLLRRMRLIPLEFEDRNRLKKIVEANRRRQRSEAETIPGEQLQVMQWSPEAIRTLVASERTQERENIQKMEASLKARNELDNQALPSPSKILRLLMARVVSKHQ